MELALEFERVRDLDDDAILADLGHLLREHQSRARVNVAAAALDGVVIEASDAESGRHLWEAIKKAAAKNICDEKDGLKAITERSELEAAMAVIITPVLSAQLGPWGAPLGIIAAGIVTLAIRTGIDTFCELCAE